MKAFEEIKTNREYSLGKNGLGSSKLFLINIPIILVLKNI